MKLFALVALLVVGVVHAQVTSTRTTAYDWQCTDSAGVRISDHARFDTAFVACLNAPNGVYVQGGRYRITKPVAPAPTAGSATLSWVPPTTNTDGSPVVITGYRIVYGTGAAAMTQAIEVTAVSSYVVEGLAPGTWYFALRALSSNGAESALSNIASKTIT